MSDSQLLSDCEAAGESGSEESVDVSVVIPISERNDDLREIYLQHRKALAEMGGSCEFVFVVDGPMPEVLASLRKLKEEHADVTVMLLNRWFGEATALAVGFERARGKVILTLPAYFQVEPEEISRMMEQLRSGETDIVIPWRTPRIDPSFNRWQSRGFHWLVRLLTGTEYHDISCGVRVLKREVAQRVRLYGDFHRFYPILAHERGFRVSELAVRQSPHDVGRRVHAPGVYLRRLLDILALFFLFKFTKKPLRFFGLIGTALAFSGAAVTGYLGLYRLFGAGAIAGRPLLVLGILLIVLGAQLFSIGLLGEIIIFTHAARVKEYSVQEILS